MMLRKDIKAGDGMAERRIFVIWTHPLFYESVRLLLKHPEIIWVGAALNFRAAYEEILRAHPDTILFEKSSPGVPMDVMEILEANDWNMRIIGLSLDDNEMSVYHRQHQTVEKAGDLLELILA